MPILLLLPAIFGLISTCLGPLLESHKTGIIAKILAGAFDGSSNSLLGIIESVLGNIDSIKKAELEVQLQTLLANARIDEIDAKSDRFFQWGWRPFLAWGLSVALLMSCLVVPFINYVAEWMGYAPPSTFVLTNATMAMLSGLCGIYMGARTYEKTRP